MSTSLRWARVPWWILGVAVLLSVGGVAFLHSTSSSTPKLAGQDERQLLFLVAGLGVFAVTFMTPLGAVRARAGLIYAGALLALVGLAFFGSRVNGAQSWYRFGSFALQPSEFAKLAMIVALAGYLRFRSGAGAAEGVLVPLLLAAVPAGLVLRQPDLGSALVFFPVMLAMSYAAGVPGRRVLGIVAAGLALFVAAIPFLHGYQRQRIAVWWNQGALTSGDLAGPAYQPHQSLIAVGSGGWTGAGFARGPQNQLDFLPYRSVDYIFSVVAEETGFVGALAVLMGFLAVVIGLLAAAARVRERFARLCVVGVAAWIGTQVFIHVSVCTNLLPTTGLTLPFFSAGGSSLVAVFAGLGLALNAVGRMERVLARDGFE